MNIELRSKRDHYCAHALMVWVVNLSDRMTVPEMAYFTGCSTEDVQCMVDAYESMGRDYVWMHGREASQQWAAICLRRFWARKYWRECPSRGLSKKILGFYSMFSHPHKKLGGFGPFVIKRDLLAMRIYRTAA